MSIEKQCVGCYPRRFIEAKDNKEERVRRLASLPLAQSMIASAEDTAGP